MKPVDIRYVVSALPMEAGIVPAGTTPPAPTPMAALESVTTTMTLGTPGSAVVRNTGSMTASWALATGSGNLTATPASGTLAPGATQAVVLSAIAAAGYQLVLSVTGGAATGTPVSIMASLPAAPAAGFSAAPTSGTVPFAVTVTSTATGTGLSYSYNWGDGSAVSTSANPSHAYTAAGSYTITQTVTDAFGRTATATRSITASAAPSYATSLALTITGSTATGATASVVVTPNGPIAPGGGTVTLAKVSGPGSLGATSVTLTGGSSGPFTTTVSNPNDGTTVINMVSNTLGLNMSPSTASYTTTTAAPAGTPAAFTLTSATSGTLPFAVGYAMRQGDVPSGSDIAISGATAKATILNTWPDGSAKFALIAGTYTSAGSAVTVTPSAGTNAAGTALTGSSVQTAMGSNTAVFGCGAFGTVTFSGADFASPFKTHAATSAFGEFIYRKAVGADAHLVAWMAVRLWASGAVEVLPWIENGYFNVASPTNKSATYSFTLGGTSRFSAAIDLPNHCRTPLVSGSALSHWLGTDPGVGAKHDGAYLQATELVPTYFATVDPGAAAVTGLPSTFTPLQQGGYPTSMGSAGYDPSIGLLPEWDALALTTTANVSAAIQRNAYSAGRYGIHHRDETTNRPPRFSSYPTTVLGDGAAISSTGSSTTSTFTPTATGTAPADFAPSHMPSMGFMAYLLTGRWYHMETMQFVATANHFRSSTAPREDASGILQTWSATSTRGAAWGLRALAQAACCTPDSDTTIRTELLAVYAANIARHHATYVAGSNGSMGFMQPYTNYTATVYQNAGAGSTSTSIVLPGGTSSTTGEYAKVFANGGHWTITIGGETRNVTAWGGLDFTATVSPAFTVPTAGQYAILRSGHWFEASWQQDFYTAALGYVGCLGLGVDSTTRTKWAEFFAWKAKSVVGRFGGTAANEYLYRDAAAYEFPVAKNDTTWANFYTDWGEVWTDAELQNARGSKVMGDRSLRGTTTDLSSYWGNLQPALAYCIRHGIYGAAEARSLMMGAPNWPALAATANDYPVWAVRAPIAAWRVGQATNAWREILDTKISDIPSADPAPTSGRQDAWNSLVLKPETDELRLPGTGGHADCVSNAVDGADMRRDAPAWVTLAPPSPTSVVTLSPAYSAYYSDGKPSSIHSYYSMHWINSIQRVVRMWGGATSWSGNPMQEFTVWNEATQSWDARSLWQAGTTIGYALSSGYSYAKHPRTEEVVIWVYNADIRKWTPGVPGTFTTLVSGPSNPAPSASAAAIDPTRGTNGAGEMFVLGGGAGGTMCRVFDIGNNSLRTITLSGVDISTGRPGIGLFYVPATDRYYACVANPTAGALVYVITPSSVSDTWACALMTTTGGGAIPETVGTDSGGAYPWGKFLYSPRTGCAYFAPRWGANLWALKLHEV